MDKMIQEPRIVSTYDCWLWAMSINIIGYGRLGDEFAHRIVYESYYGKIPAGLEIDHLCRIPRCVNPEHLEAVTHRENMRRSNPYRKDVIKRLLNKKTHCSRGHELTPDNCYVFFRDKVSQRVRKQCKKCKNRQSSQYYARKKLNKAT